MWPYKHKIRKFKWKWILKLFPSLATVLQIYSCTASPNSPSIALASPTDSPGPLKSVLILGCGHFCLPDFGCETFLVCAGLVLADTSQIWTLRYGKAECCTFMECWRCCVVLNPLAEIQRKVDKVVLLPNCHIEMSCFSSSSPPGDSSVWCSVEKWVLC